MAKNLERQKKKKLEVCPTAAISVGERLTLRKIKKKRKIKMMNRLKEIPLDCKGTTSWAHKMEEYFRNDRGKVLLFYAL